MTGDERPDNGTHQAGTSALRRRLFIIIFKADTPAGRLFDVLLILAILLSVLAVMLASVAGVAAHYGEWLYLAEWLFTVLFTVEYVVRLYCVRDRMRYARSFYGIVDLLSVLPLYLDLLLAGAGNLLVIRILRILRIFRVLKLQRYMGEADIMLEALTASRRKIMVFLYTVFTIVVVFGALMYLVEGPAAGFTSIPVGMYWAVVTLTTVGYGDITPLTPFGQGLAAIIMVTGYGIIAVPTGIYASELTQLIIRRRRRTACAGCGTREHADDARYCRLCGTALPPSPGT